MPPLPAHILSAASQDWGSRAWLCTLKPVARRPESLGTQIMVLFKLVVHLHPGWMGVWALGAPGSPLPAPLPSPTWPSSESISHCTSDAPCLYAVLGRSLESTNFLIWKMGMTVAVTTSFYWARKKRGWK